MIDLEERLALLEFDIDELDLVNGVLDRVDGASTSKRRPWLLVAAAVLVVLVVTIAVTPGSRRTVAGWLGLDSVRVERVPVLDLPIEPTTFELPGPGETITVEVDGHEILVSTIPARLDDVSLVKTVDFDTEVEKVTVNGHRGLWLSGRAHLVAYDAETGREVAVAGNTLLWEEDEVLHRVEGFETLDGAIEFAALATS